MRGFLRQSDGHVYETFGISKHETFGNAQSLMRANSFDFITISPIFYIHLKFTIH